MGNEEQKSIDWHEESECISDDAYFKPQSGRYRIGILSDGKSTAYVNKDTDEVTEQVEFDVETKDLDEEGSSLQRQVWTVTKGKTEGSLYGQLVRLIKNNGFKPSGVVFELLVSGIGKNKRYQIPSAIKLFKNDKKSSDDHK